jgi:hypothetical protein
MNCLDMYKFNLFNLLKLTREVVRKLRDILFRGGGGESISLLGGSLAMSVRPSDEDGMRVNAL